MSERPVDGEDGPSFLGRWSERKRRAVEPSGDGHERPADVAAPVDASAEVAGSAPVLTDADMPPLESLGGTSDLSVFLGDGVSAALRKAALRRVFSAAAFNARDGLNDYDGDYTVFEPLGDTVTADMKFHAARRERAERERAEAEALAREQGEPASPDDTDDAAGSTGTDTVAETPEKPETLDGPSDPGTSQPALSDLDGIGDGARLAPPADAGAASDASDAVDRHDTSTETLPPA